MNTDSRVAELLASPRYEVLPFGDVEEAVLEHVPTDVTLTVTVSPRKGIEHTLANFETAFYRSPVADNSSFEQWESEGASDAARRANAHWKRALAEYEPPPLDDAIREELEEWIEQRKASFPDSDV